MIRLSSTLRADRRALVVAPHRRFDRAIGADVIAVEPRVVAEHAIEKAHLSFRKPEVGLLAGGQVEPQGDLRCRSGGAGVPTLVALDPQHTARRDLTGAEEAEQRHRGVDMTGITGQARQLQPVERDPRVVVVVAVAIAGKRAIAVARPVPLEASQHRGQRGGIDRVQPEHGRGRRDHLTERPHGRDGRTALRSVLGQDLVTTGPHETLSLDCSPRLFRPLGGDERGTVAHSSYTGLRFSRHAAMASSRLPV